jgi:hypothetical protein
MRPRGVPVSLEPDPVIDAFKPGIDVTLLDENLKRTPEERLRRLQQLIRYAEELKAAGERARRSARPAATERS